MIIGIDARSLLTSPRTGVGEYTYELLSHIFQQDTPHRYILFANGYDIDTTSLPFSSIDTVTWVTSRIPNKLFHTLIAGLGIPHLDTYVAKRAGVEAIDVWFSPNLHFTSLSKHVKHVLTIHDLSFHHYPEFYSPKGRLWHTFVRPKKQIQHADCILTPSQHTKRDVIDVYGVDASSVHTIYPGVSSSLTTNSVHTTFDIKKKYNLPDEYLLYLGTLEPRKNIDGIIDAYMNSAYLKKKMPIVFAGALGYKGKLYKKRIEQTEGAQYIGYVEADEKTCLYTDARALVYPSLYEGFGLPVLEAMYCGTPAILSHRTSLPEIGETQCIYVHPYNTSSLQKAMEDIVHISNKDEHSIQTPLMQETFSWDVAAASVLTQCERVCE